MKAYTLALMLDDKFYDIQAVLPEDAEEAIDALSCIQSEFDQAIRFALTLDVAAEAAETTHPEACVKMYEIMKAHAQPILGATCEEEKFSTANFAIVVYDEVGRIVDSYA